MRELTHRGAALFAPFSLLCEEGCWGSGWQLSFLQARQLLGQEGPDSSPAPPWHDQPTMRPQHPHPHPSPDTPAALWNLLSPPRHTYTHTEAPPGKQPLSTFVRGLLSPSGSMLRNAAGRLPANAKGPLGPRLAPHSSPQGQAGLQRLSWNPKSHFLAKPPVSHLQSGDDQSCCPS